MDAASTSEAVGFITLMQDLKRKLNSWEQQLEVREGGTEERVMREGGRVGGRGGGKEDGRDEKEGVRGGDGSVAR